MNEVKILNGEVFFQKDSFEIKNSAILTIEDDNYTVEIEGIHYLVGDFQDIIQGVFKELGYVTLVGCHLYGSSIGSVNTFTYKIQNILTEVKFSSKDDLKFSSMSVEMPLLKKWLNKSSITGNIVFQNKIEYLGNQKFDLFKTESYEVSVSLFCKESYSQANILIEEYVELKISALNEQLSLFQFLDIYKKTKLLVSFLGNYHSGKDVFFLTQNEIIYENQDNLLVLKLYTSPLNLMNNFSFDFVFSYDDLKDYHQLIFSSWFENEKLQESINLLVQKNYLKLSPEVYFLNTCFSLETLHRKFFKNYVYDLEHFEVIKKGIICKLNEDEKKLFIDKLQFANEPSLRSRLKEFKEEFSIILTGKYKVNNLIDVIVETRNYLVHRGEKRQILNSYQMLKVARVLENIVKLSIFKLIGVNNEMVIKKIKKINYDNI